MSKPYGLILPGQQKRQTAALSTREVSRPSIFDESSESDDEGPPQLKMKNAPIAPGVMERRIARRQQEKALAEDPTIFQYDELYDEMEAKREDEKQTKSNDPKKPKYIERLMVCAERRKLENERRIERQVQKEREEEGEQFKGKESFVTTAYRQKLEELRKLEEQEKRDDYLESIGDVTKQSDLDGFYRHIYEQKMGTTKVVEKPEIPTATNVDEITYKPIKSTKSQQRAYRKRHSSAEEAEEEKESEAQQTAKKAHLQNNMDADSDFSIDSSSDDDRDEGQKEKGPQQNAGKQKTESVAVKAKSSVGNENTKDVQVDANTVALKLENMKKEPEANDDKNFREPEQPAPEPKKNKEDIWKKRTVGEVLDAAVQRYYERKAARNA